MKYSDRLLPSEPEFIGNGKDPPINEIPNITYVECELYEQNQNEWKSIYAEIPNIGQKVYFKIDDETYKGVFDGFIYDLKEQKIYYKFTGNQGGLGGIKTTIRAIEWKACSPYEQRISIGNMIV